MVRPTWRGVIPDPSLRVGGWRTPVARIGGGETSQRREETEREEKGDTMDVDKSVMSGALRRAV